MNYKVTTTIFLTVQDILRTNGGLNLVLWVAKTRVFMAMLNTTLQGHHYMTGLQYSKTSREKRNQIKPDM